MEQVIAHKKPKRVAVAAAEHNHVIEAIMRARRDGFVEPYLVGNKDAIYSILRELGETLEEGNIYDTPDVNASARTAVQLVKQGKADFLMKGKLNTSELLKAALDKESGLSHSGLVTHMTMMELPAYHKMIVINDPGILLYPTLEQKILQIRAVTDALHTMGYGDDIKIAALCAVENVNPKMQESVDAAELKRMNQAGEITGCIIEGPISMDIAMDPEAAMEKGFNSPVVGDADVLLVPNIVTGNVLVKTLAQFAGATPVGMVLGACVPISMSSRAASAQTKYLSLAVTSAAVK